MLAKKTMLVYYKRLFEQFHRNFFMNETCKSCGTVFEVDESILKNIKWFKCGVCNYKWDLSKDINSDDEEERYDPSSEKKRGKSINVRKTRW